MSSKLTGFDPEADAARGGIKQRVVQNVSIVSVASDEPLDLFWCVRLGNSLISPSSGEQIWSTCRDMTSSTSRSNSSPLSLISSLDIRFLIENREQLSYGIIRSIRLSARMRDGDQCISRLKHFA